MATIDVTLAGELRHISGTELDPVTSPFTGRPLRRVVASLTVRGNDLHEAVKRDLDAARNGDPVVGPDGNQWGVVSSSYSYSDEGGPYKHDVTFEEREVVRAERLEFADLVLVPERYSERYDDDDSVLVVEAVVRLSGDDNKSLERFMRDHDGYFPLRRVGVREEAVAVRFGRCLWEQIDGGARHYLVFVADEGVEREGGRGFETLVEPWGSRVREIALRNGAVLDALLDELEATGALSADALARVRARGDSVDELGREYARTIDLDSFVTFD